MVGGIFYSQLRQLDIQTKVKTAEITCDQHFSSRFQQDQDCRRCLANGLNISGAPDSEVKMKNIFMSCSMVDVSSDGDLNFPRVEKCKWCKSSRLHLGSAGTAGDWGKANTKCGRAPPWIDQPPLARPYWKWLWPYYTHYTTKQHVIRQRKGKKCAWIILDNPNIDNDDRDGNFWSLCPSFPK